MIFCAKILAKNHNLLKNLKLEAEPALKHSSRKGIDIYLKDYWKTYAFYIVKCTITDKLLHKDQLIHDFFYFIIICTFLDKTIIPSFVCDSFKTTNEISYLKEF